MTTVLDIQRQGNGIEATFFAPQDIIGLLNSVKIIISASILAFFYLFRKLATFPVITSNLADLSSLKFQLNSK